MKNLFRSLFLALFCLLTLSACVSREQADDKLARGCAAGVQALLPENMTIKEIKDKEFADSPEGPNMRYVKLKAVTLDGWLETEQEYQCIFEESFGFMKASYTASVYQVRTGDTVYGKSGNEILGNAQDFLKLTDAIRKAMYQ